MVEVAIKGGTDEFFILLTQAESIIKIYGLLTPDQIDGLDIETKATVSASQHILEQAKEKGIKRADGQQIFTSTRPELISDIDKGKILLKMINLICLMAGAMSNEQMEKLPIKEMVEIAAILATRTEAEKKFGKKLDNLQ